MTLTREEALALMRRALGCAHATEHVIGLSHEHLWCSVCGAVREVRANRWAVPMLVAYATAYANASEGK